MAEKRPLDRTAQLPPLPAAFIDRMRAMLGEELDAFVAALQRPDEGLRVNTLRLSPEKFGAISPFEISPLGYAAEAFELSPGQRAGRHPYHAAGLYYLQDPGAMVVAAMIDPRPGERVLDISAAPGGKATHLAARMGGRGLLVANDVNASRARELVGNVERCGVTNAIVTSESAERLARHFGPSFDRVLVDAPCSGESMFHKSVDARADWSPAAIEGCARRQDDLLQTASELVAPGGILVYSTCTFSKEENEGVVDRFLSGNGEFEPGASFAPAGAEPIAVGEGGRVGYRLWPHRVSGAGHFIAVLKREERGEPAEVLPARNELERAPRRLLESFFADVLGQEPPDPDRITTIGEDLYLLPQPSTQTKGLRVLRSGLWLGTLLKDRFEPSHALALAPGTAGSERVTSFEVGDPRVKGFLSGNTVTSEGEPGWTPVAVDGFVLGWGKRVGATIKNHYPKGLRIRG